MKLKRSHPDNAHIFQKFEKPIRGVKNDVNLSFLDYTGKGGRDVFRFTDRSDVVEYVAAGEGKVDGQAESAYNIDNITHTQSQDKKEKEKAVRGRKASKDKDASKSSTAPIPYYLSPSGEAPLTKLTEIFHVQALYDAFIYPLVASNGPEV